MPNRKRVTGVRRTAYSWTRRITASDAATITAYLTAMGADHPTTAYAKPTTTGWCST
ncbi:hypothetical protein [Streptomyces sp. NBC_00289]|uniref:hypothetical protein n=1 Tax=Streptomyces sp. NBC_00289 TaxID=2975703 RepID=UPI00352E6628